MAETMAELIETHKKTLSYKVLASAAANLTYGQQATALSPYYFALSRQEKMETFILWNDMAVFNLCNVDYGQFARFVVSSAFDVMSVDLNGKKAYRPSSGGDITNNTSPYSLSLCIRIIEG